MWFCGSLGPGIVCVPFFILFFIDAATGSFCVLLISFHWSLSSHFLSQSLPFYCMQPVGSYAAKISHMISKIIAHVLGDSMKEVMLPQQQRGCDVYGFRWIGCTLFLSISCFLFHVSQVWFIILSTSSLHNSVLFLYRLWQHAGILPQLRLLKWNITNIIIVCLYDIVGCSFLLKSLHFAFCKVMAIFIFLQAVDSGPVSFPSLLSHLTSAILNHEVLALPVVPKKRGVPPLRTFSPLATALPCDFHLLNLRSIQNQVTRALLKYCRCLNPWFCDFSRKIKLQILFRLKSNMYCDDYQLVIIS